MRYYHSDHLGSSNVITDETGHEIQSYEYTPYGTIAKNELANPQTGSPVHHYFTGKELDNTGLYFYGARYYDPEIGRFITPDTIVQAPYDPQSLNRYSYCRNNPINYTDPTGHFWAELIWTAIVIVVGWALDKYADAEVDVSGGVSIPFDTGGGGGGRNATYPTSPQNTAYNPNSNTNTSSQSIYNSVFDIFLWPDVDRTYFDNTNTIRPWLRSVNSAITKTGEFFIDRAKKGFSRCPRYGNWGGEDWSGGMQIRAGQIGPDIDAVDQMDGYFKQHDIGRYNALKVSRPSLRQLFRANYDRTLYRQLKSLPEDPSDWSPPAENSDRAKRYRKEAEWYFGLVTERGSK